MAKDEKAVGLVAHIVLMRESWGEECCEVSLLRLEENGDGTPSVRNLTSSGWDVHPMADLSMRGHAYISRDSARRLIAIWPEYRHMFSVDLPRARIMVDVLTKLNQFLKRKREKCGYDLDNHRDMARAFLEFAGVRGAVVSDYREPDAKLMWSERKVAFVGVADALHAYERFVAHVLASAKPL